MSATRSMAWTRVVLRTFWVSGVLEDLDAPVYKLGERRNGVDRPVRPMCNSSHPHMKIRNQSKHNKTNTMYLYPIYTFLEISHK